MEARPDVISTYRMLRLALAALAAAILLVAALQTARQGCVLTSISAYWYTPGRTVFVSCLVAIGVCLVALRGGTWTENLLLNLAGMLAPVVAIVPTRLGDPHDLRCLGPAATPSTLAAVDDGLTVYLVVAAAGFVVAVISSTVRSRRTGPVDALKTATRFVGLALALGVLVGLTLWRLLARTTFVEHAHTVTAVTMFVMIGLVVGFRTRPLARLSARWDGYRDDSIDQALTSENAGAYSAAYAVIAGFMLLALAVSFVGFEGWAFRVIAVEGLLLGAFIVFWLLQTWQLRGSEPG